MIQYCINTIICSGLLFFLYKALLEGEKMHVFKRFYLLSSLVLSLIAPLITISFYLPAENILVEYISSEPADLVLSQPMPPIQEKSNTLYVVVGFIYLAGLGFSFFRFFKNIHYFLTAHKRETIVPFNQVTLVLMEKNIIPHSFLNNIFLNRKSYLEGKIEDEILVHELAHVKQYHSIDILLSQFIQCIFWFNPLFRFYTKAIQLNHEFLADESVVRSGSRITYQRLLLSKASGKENFSLASPFNYYVIKKRLVMIAKNTSPQVVVAKKLIAVPLLIATLFLFIQKETHAQNPEQRQMKNEVTSTTSGASSELISEYETIVKKHESKNPKGYIEYSPFSKIERERLLAIYQMMSMEQQKKQNIIFRAKLSHFEKAVPTQAQLQLWKNPEMYGVWVGQRRIKNSDLSKYKSSDFYHYFVSKLSKTAINYGKHYYQVDLMTKEQYEGYVKEWNALPDYALAVRNGKLNFGGNRYMIMKSSN